jgi:Rod binding domain-containing protein
MSAINPAAFMTSGTPTGIARPKNGADAAQQFESLLLHQLLKSASSEEGGWLGTGEEDSAGLQALSLAQEQFASALAASGGLGLAKLLEPQLRPNQEE